MSIGKGIAIAGIWIGTAISAFPMGIGAIVVAICAMFATAFVARSS